MGAMRTALRLFSHHRSLTALAVSTLSTALALTTALASVADAILFRPLPVAHPDRIVRIFTGSSAQPLGLVSYPDFEDFRRASRILAIVAQSQVLVAAGDPAEMRLALAVTPDYFQTLQVRIAPGRAFLPAESQDPVVILSHSFWQSHFAADSHAIGRTILLCGTPFTIIGVAAENFALDRFSREDFYFPVGVYESGLLPVTGHPLQDRSRRYLSLYAALARNATIAQARAELNAIAQRLESQYPEDRSRRPLVLTEFQSRTYLDRTTPALAALLAVLGVVMLNIAGANLAALLRERSESRARELAVRLAVGATPFHLLCDTLIETTTLTVASATLAIPIAFAMHQALAKSVALPTDLAFSLALRIDARTAASLIAATALITLLSGLTASRHIEILKTRTTRTSTLCRHILATLEVAFATALVACSAFLLTSIAAARRTDLGYRTDHVLVFALDPAQIRQTESQARAFYSEVLDRVRALPAVKSAELAQSVPLGYTAAQRQIVVNNEPVTLWMNIVGPRYFDLMHLAVTQGRAFDDSDTAQSDPVAIVNQEFAKQCGVGCIFRMNGRSVRVIGVARTARYFQVNEPPRPYFYLPFSQNYASRMILHVETTGDPAAMAHAVVDQIHRLSAAQPISEIRPLSAYSLQGAMFQAGIALRILTAVGLGGIALVLAGLSTIVAHTASRCRSEIGIRMSLGASRQSIILLLSAGAAKILVPGIALGLAAAALAMPFLRQLVPAPASGPAIFAFSAMIIALAVTPAVLIPARKAAQLDPAQALRAQ